MTEQGRARTEAGLRAVIARGDMPPGHRLVEADLAVEFGVSRGSVRAALDTLIAEDLVERIPNLGARVRVVSTAEAIAITECRLALEGLIARRAAERITATDRLALHQRRAELRAAVEGGDLLGYSALIHELHVVLRSISGQTVAGDLIDRLRAQLVRHRFQLSLRPGRAAASLHELEAVVDAVEAGDPDRAEAAATAHFHQVIVALAATMPAEEELA